MGKSYRDRDKKSVAKIFENSFEKPFKKPFEKVFAKTFAKTFKNTQWISLDAIYISESTIAKLLARDFHQIDAMRVRFENGQEMVRVVLHERAGGGFAIEDGRHRVIAAKLAGAGFIEAEIVGLNG